MASKHGVVMRGSIIDMPYPDENWSGKGRRVYYVRMRLSHRIHPEKALLLLTTDDLVKAMPGFNWEEGHSGVILSDAMAKQLDDLWHDYVEKRHQMAEDDKNPYFLWRQTK